MTEEKTCYNCGNKNCHIFYATVKQDVAEHHETYEYRNFDCVNHDNWEEMKVEEIRTDSTEPLKNALGRIAELEKKNAEIKSIAEFQQSSNMTTHFENKKLKEALAVGSTWNKGLNSRNKYLEEERDKYRNMVFDKMGQLTKAKEIIGEFVEWANWQDSKCPSFKSIQNKAEQFLKTEALAVRSPKRTQNDPDKLTDDVMNDWKEMED